MASAVGRAGGMSLVAPMFMPITAAAVAYVAWKVRWRVVAERFFTGKGWNSRILLLVFVVLNWKSMPFAWTIRVFNAIIYHTFVRKPPILGPRALFCPMISQSHSPLLEIDYNIHKSNSNYFADLDVSRSHLMTYLTRPGLRKVTYNKQHKVVVDSSGKVVEGGLGVMLGAVHCSFRREIPAYKPYELWSRILSWDRKWIYIVTHFVEKGVRPTEWLDPKFRNVRTRIPGVGKDWDRKVYATGISKYVLKIGRFTIHPAIVLEESGLLPPRPRGWRGGEDDMGETQPEGEGSTGKEWDWVRVEMQRRKGLEMALNFANLDGLMTLFEAGEGGAIGKFGLG